MAENLTLWGIGTPRTLRAHWMLEEQGLDYALRPVRSRSGETMSQEFLALNPKHKIPVLRHGAMVLTESAAIIDYLSRAFPVPDGFHVPEDLFGRTRLNELCLFIICELDALSLYVIRRHEGLADLYGAAPNVVQRAKEYFTDQVNALTGNFQGGGEFLMEGGMSVADILLATCLTSARSSGIDLPDCLIAYEQRLTERPAYQRAQEVNFPD
jgi:glutathione S-transferase